MYKWNAACQIQGTLKLVESSFDWKGDTLSFDTLNEKGIKQTHHIEVDAVKLGLSGYTKEQIANRMQTELTEGDSKIETGLGVFSTFVSILGTAEYFSKGEHGRAIFSSAEVAYSIGGLTEINDVVERVTKKAFQNVVAKTAKTLGLQKTMKSLSALDSKALGKSGSKILGNLAGNIPFVGLAFDIYSIAEDIKDLADKNSLTPLGLKIGHLVLDVTLTVLSLVKQHFQ